MNNELLSEDQALSIYKTHLCTPRLNHKKELVNPCRSKTFKGMMKAHVPNKVSELIQAYIDNNKRILFWSDHHFYHNNIIEYSDRPFKEVVDMNIQMIENYKKIVRDDDLVVFGGDLSFASLEKTEELLKGLPGKKVLIIGNHDLDRSYKMIPYTLFDEIAVVAVFHKEIEGKLANIILSHYPIENNLLPENTINIHGHTHQYNAGIKNINISVEHMEYSPKVIDEKINYTFMENYDESKFIKRHINRN